MKYLCLVYALAAHPQSTVDANASGENDGEWIHGCLALYRGESNGEAVRLAVHDWRVTLSIPTEAEPRRLESACLLEALDLNDAIRRAARLPCSHMASIEIHRVVDVCDSPEQRPQDAVHFNPESEAPSR